MVDERLSPVRQAHLIIQETRDLNLTVANVSDITERAAKVAVDVAEATYVKPKRVVMYGTIAGTAVIAIAAGGVLWMTHAWSLPWQVSLGALAVIGVPFGLVATKVLPRLLEQAVASH